MTNIAEFRGKSPDELKDEALKLKKELFNLRFQVASGEFSNTSRFRAVRRDIARIKTLLSESGEPKAAAPKKAKSAEAEKPAKETKAKKPATKKKAAGE